MTMVRPCRLITRQRSHMGLTEGLTFIAWEVRTRASASRRGPSWYQNPCSGGQNPGPLGRHGHGVLEMGRQRGIGGRERPIVVVGGKRGAARRGHPPQPHPPAPPALRAPGGGG